MFAPLLGAIHADIDRQVGWAKDEVPRQTRYAMMTASADVAALPRLARSSVLSRYAHHLQKYVPGTDIYYDPRPVTRLFGHHSLRYRNEVLWKHTNDAHAWAVYIGYEEERHRYNRGQGQQHKRA
jgi:hypothetical protein